MKPLTYSRITRERIIKEQIDYIKLEPELIKEFTRILELALTQTNQQVPDNLVVNNITLNAFYKLPKYSNCVSMSFDVGVENNDRI